MSRSSFESQNKRTGLNLQMVPQGNSQRSSTSLFDNSLWDIKKAAERLSVSEGTLRDWVYKRQIPFKKVGYLVRFDPSEIHQWIEERSKDNGHRSA